jgi:ATP-dependent helicase/nuclease subunit B
MTSIAKSTDASQAMVGVSAHPGEACWADVMAQLEALFSQHGVHPSKALVLVPYAQLMQQARDAWIAQAARQGAAAVFVPRFETTMNWASAAEGQYGAAAAAAEDIQQDAAMDALTAAALLERAGLGAQQGVLTGRLVEAAWSLARVAAAQPPQHRLAWGERLAAQTGLGLEAPVLALELAVARIAMAWAAASNYPTDVLFSAQPALFVVLEGFQTEPITESLKAHFGERSASLRLTAPEAPGLLALHEAQDAEDEAHRAAACVLAHLAAGRTPVALIAQDRVLTRRVRAMLAEHAVAIRDETGWKLSTTRAAASLMSLLRALAWDASSDAVLDWLKNAPTFEAAQVMQLEVFLRKAAIRLWSGLPENPEGLATLVGQVQSLRDGLTRGRPLRSWLRDVRDALKLAGQWEALVADAAGSDVVDALRLREGSGEDLPAGVRMSLQDFSTWVNQALESASFSPAHPPVAQVIVLPLSQLLGRPVQAVVLPGADEVRLAVSPEASGAWTPQQREVLGLPSRAELAGGLRKAWDYALCMPHLDVLWRTSEGGEKLMPSGFVQELILQRSLAMAADPRDAREIPLQPTLHPMPTGAALPVRKLSATAYEDLRRCPYRFFALRQLRLQDAAELESEPGKREFGNWLHTLLNTFHEALKTSPTPEPSARIAMINIAAEHAAQALGLTDSEFLPFAAIWPRVRDGYLEWLSGHEATGAHYTEGESWHEMPYGDISLVGKLDRIDQLSDGSRLVMDYKTEARTTTQARIKDAREDTQLAFYAALLADDSLGAAYVNLGEKEPTKTYDQPDVVQLRDELVDSILVDMARISRGSPLPALGEGKACEYCAARGLCRKDFW